jgi:uncharacterized damage-inducible protein DinB
MCAPAQIEYIIVIKGEFMNTKSLFVFLSLTLGCFAQTSDAQANRSNTQILDFILDYQEKAVLAVAESMPPEKYDFVPTAGAFQGVRSFADQLKHIAADNYILGAGILGEEAPGNIGPNESGSSSVRTKLEVIAYVRDSFAYMHRAAAAIDDANAPIATPDISPWPAGTATRLGVAIEDCVHIWDHYGQLVEYLRMNGIVPPGSRPDSNAIVIAHSTPNMSQALDFWISNSEKEVISAADAMPEQKHSFVPTGGEFAVVRTFAEQLKHLAANNYRMAARMLGQAATPDQEAELGPKDIQTKSQIATLHQAVATVTAENAVAPVFALWAGTGRQNTRVQFAVDAIAHSYDHHGQMVEYLRMNGIIPPAGR